MAVGKRTGVLRIAGLLPALALPGAIALPLALAVMALTAPLAAIAALVLLALAGIGAGVELLLQVAERLVAEPLLIAQGVGQPFHRALSF